MSERLLRTMVGVVAGWSILAGLLAAEQPPGAKPPWQRLLQGAEAKTAKELAARVAAERQAGKWEEALRAAEELAELRRKVQGKDHWEAVNARWQVQALRAVQRQDSKVQKQYVGLAGLQSQADALVQSGRYREAQPLLEEVLAIHRKVLGEEHPHTALSYDNAGVNRDDLGQYEVAAESLHKALAIRCKLLGEEHPDTAQSYNNVAYNQGMQGKYKAAGQGYQKALAIRLAVLGEEHRDTATSYNNIAANLSAQGQYVAAEEVYRKALRIFRKVFGEEHPYTAIGYNNLAVNLSDQGKYAAAEEDSRKALDIRRKVFGEEHPQTANSYNNLAYDLSVQGKYKDADDAYMKALDINRKLLGDDHPETAAIWNNIALNLTAEGQYAAAAEVYRKALTIFRRALGEQHHHTAQAYNNLAANLQDQGQYAAAEEMYRKALDIFRQALGELHSDTAAGYGNLAVNLKAQGNYVAAEENSRKALAIDRKALGEEHTETATCYNKLAGILNARGQYAAAEESARKALAIDRKVFGEDHPQTATCCTNVAFNLHAQEKYVEAEEWSRKALAIRRKALGEEHPATAQSYDLLANDLHAEGKYSEAEDLWLRAADAFARARPRLAHSGLERATITAERSPLPRLAAVLARNGKPAAAWQRYEESLARGTWDDLSARLRRPAAEQARQTALLARLDRLDQLLAQTMGVTDEAAQQKQRAGLLDQRRAAQEELDAFIANVEKTYGPAAGQVFDIPRIQAALADDAALVGWVDVKAAGPKAADPNGEHWAFLLRSSGPPVCLLLHGSGPGETWTEEDTDLPSRLRTALVEHHGDWQPLAQRLGEQRLKPLRRHLGAQDRLPPVRRLVVLPSALLAGVPLEALGDDFTVSYALSGTLHAHLKTQPGVKGKGLLALADPIFETTTAPAKSRPLPPGGVLLTLVQPGSNAAQSHLRPDDVLLKYGDRELTTPKDLRDAVAAADGKGDVTVEVWRDGKVLQREVHAGKLGVVLATEPAPKVLAERYRVDRVLTARRGDDDWMQLPGTRVEVESLRRLIAAEPPPLLLFDSDASEQRLDALAGSGELAKYRFVHLATHGDVDNTRALRSALILSRDALPDAQKQLLAGKPVYDGRLTAEEMLRSWRLDAELVTLSACETALGKYERGEGFVGFAQALILCGSRSVCLSLWKVDDGATALLMQRFYANLLGKREGLKGPLPKAEALREAKEWLRTLPREEALRVAAAVSSGVARAKGRPKAPLLPPVPERTAEAKADCPYAHPYYWAAFVLIGSAE
jgi:tetratricopeptide (TPR) repeat protein